MRYLRVSIAEMMMIVLYVAVGFAAFRNANEIWAEATYTIAFLSLTAATLAAIAWKGTPRVTWAGFAVFGWGRFLFGTQTHMVDGVFGYGWMPAPSLLTTPGINHLLSYFVPARGFDHSHAQVYFALEVLFFSLFGSVIGRVMARRNDHSSPRIG